MDATTKRKDLEKLFNQATTKEERNAATRAIMIYDARHESPGARCMCNAKGIIWFVTGRKDTAAPVAKLKPSHDCWENAVPYTSNGVLGHGWECGICGKFLQAG